MTTSTGRDIPFLKGHGTGNDFILLPDVDGSLRLDAADVRALCDRHTGLGADGVIRVVPTRHADEAHVREQADDAAWFMDYRNADGSIAEMCGNGTRVVAAYLLGEGLTDPDGFDLATRAGAKRLRRSPEGYAVDLGPWRLVDPVRFEKQGYDTLVSFGGDPLPALSLDLGNPHTVVALPEHLRLDDVDLTRAPLLNPPPPHGSNVEITHPLTDGHLRMRVHERGVGETRSCGTGVAAAALATMLWSGAPELHRAWRVDVPGGTVWAAALPQQRVELRGPAVLVARGTVSLDDLDPHPSPSSSD